MSTGKKKELQAQAAGLIDTTKYGVPLRNVLSRMTEHTKGPYSLLYRCVQKRIKVRVCVRSFKGLRGICTGYLVAFDRDMNMALSDVDEVYRIPSTGQRFFHEEKLTYSKIIEHSKVKPKEMQRSVGKDPQLRRKPAPESSKSNKKALAKYMKGRGSQSLQTRTETDEELTEKTEEEGKRTKKGLSKDEERRKRVGKGDGKKQKDEVLEMKVEKLNKELAQLSSSDSQSAFTELETQHSAVSGKGTMGHCDKSAVDQSGKGHEPSTSKVDKTSRGKTSESKKDQLLQPMAFETQLLKKSRTKETSASSEATGVSERTKTQTAQNIQHASQKCEQARGTSSGKSGGGKIQIRPEDFKRRHVNQLFVRGDNVVLVSVDKALLESK